MSTLIEMAKDIVMAHASTTALSKDELISEIREIYATLAALDVTGKQTLISPEGRMAAAAVEQGEAQPAVSMRKAFGKDKVTCMICGKPMKTLARHLKTTHDLKPGAYRKQFGIPRTQPLAAKSYSETRRKMAVERGLGENLAKARAARGKGKIKS